MFLENSRGNERTQQKWHFREGNGKSRHGTANATSISLFLLSDFRY
jgi:hypothetical protein